MSSSILNGNNARCKLFPLNIYCHILMTCKVSAEKSTGNHMGLLLYLSSYFCFSVFRNLSLSLIYAILIIKCIGVDLFEFLLFGILCTSWSWMSHSFPR